MQHLKGIIYLLGCETKDNEKPGSFILKSPHKEYILISVAENPSADILSWRNSLDYAIYQTGIIKDSDIFESWLQKKGGLGHTYQNWKNRYFVLKGNLLLYYSDQTKSVGMKKLKGFIEVSQITDLDEMSDGNSNHFSITVNNDKSYILAAKEAETKTKWVSEIRQRIRMIGKLSFQSNSSIFSNETIIKTGKLIRNIDLKKRKENWFVLTNINLRVYSSKTDSITLPHNWGKGMDECIPLLGCTVQYMDGSEETQYISGTEMAVIDIQGHAYLLESETSAELLEWVKAIKEKSRSLAKQIISAGDTIRLTCSAFDKNNISAGYTIMTLDKTKMTLKYLMLKKDVVIPFSQLKLVYLQQTYLFCLKYIQGDKAKQLKMKCRNAIGIFDTVEAIFEESSSENKFTKSGNTLQRDSYEVEPQVEATEKKMKRMTREMFLKNRQTLNEDQAREMTERAKRERKKEKSQKTPKESKSPRRKKQEDNVEEGRRRKKKSKKSRKKKSPKTQDIVPASTKEEVTEPMIDYNEDDVKKIILGDSQNTSVLGVAKPTQPVVLPVLKPLCESQIRTPQGSPNSQCDYVSTSDDVSEDSLSSSEEGYSSSEDDSANLE